MYLSCLLIDVGDNPDRPRPGRLWLRNLYHVHQRLAMAFPSPKRRETDADFLQPYAPEDFPEQRHIADQRKDTVDPEKLKHVHAPRNAESGFLFRIEPQSGGRVVILVLSAIEPKWDYAFHNADYLLAAPPSEPCRLHISLSLGARFRFRLTANPTKKTGTVRKSERLAMKERGTKEPKRHGRRVPVRPEACGQWLARQGELHGFRLVEPLEKTLHTAAGYVYVNKTRDPSKGQRLKSVSYEGLLEIVNVERFRQALLAGIGPAKAFGFGLLSVAPLSAAPSGQ